MLYAHENILMILQNIKTQKIHINQLMIISKVNIMSWKDTNLDTIQILKIKSVPILQLTQRDVQE